MQSPSPRRGRTYRGFFLGISVAVMTFLANGMSSNSAVAADDRDHGGRGHQMDHRRDEGRRYHHDDRLRSYGQPAYVYAPPPVYYAPPPGPPVIDFVFPLRFR